MAPRRAYISGRQLIVDGKPLLVQGICYSPVPVNESVYWAPQGDYFTNEYSFIWLRDLPLMKAMGANVVRTYGWDSNKDHSGFLDAVHANGLYLMTTFYMGDASEAPVSTQEQRDSLVSKFALQVSQYKSHPALVIWSFGNELNGVWNGFLQQLGKAAGEEPCGWDERYDDLGGCWVHKGKAPQPGSPCYDSTYCVYSRIMKFLDQAAAAAHAEADVIVVSTFADVDALYDKVERTGGFAPNLDAWSAQVYRGNTFGDFFEGISNASDKPIMLTEYGVDAYHDACGTGEQTPCFNTPGDSSGSFEDEESQAAYAVNLTREIQMHSSASEDCAHAGRGDTQCSAVGGFLMSWVDEYWKGSKTQASCRPTYDSPKFSPKTCDVKAHVTCGNWNTSQHDLCGYWLDAAPDHYVNEEWFGLTAPTQCADNLNALRPREVFWQMHGVWAPHAPKPAADLFLSCSQMVEQRCADLGRVGGIFPIIEAALLFLSHGYGAKEAPSSASSGIVVCSGHGSCTTDFRECGAGGKNVSATPCCSCDLGFAGEGCDQLDARMYAALGAIGLACLLVLGMLAISIGRFSLAKFRRGGVGSSSTQRSAYQEPLLS